jgi:hypothetical protein
LADAHVAFLDIVPLVFEAKDVVPGGLIIAFKLMTPSDECLSVVLYRNKSKSVDCLLGEECTNTKQNRRIVEARK